MSRGFRRRRKKVLRRHRGQGARKGPGRTLFLAGLALVLAAAAVAGARLGWRAYHEGRILAVNRIEVAGNRLWESSRLLQAANLEVGARLPELSLKSIRNAIIQLPGIQEVVVRRSLDGSVRVEVCETGILALRRAPDPSRRRARSWQGLTASGAWIPLAGATADVPVVGDAGSVDGTALACFLAGARERTPELFGGFSQIAPGRGGEADIYWRDGRFKVRVDYANKSLNSLEFLQALLRRESASWQAGSTVDLRVEGYAYVL